MTDTIESMATPIDQLQLAQQLVEQARAEGIEVIGPGDLLTGLTKSVLETEMNEHLGIRWEQRRQLPLRHPDPTA